MVGAVSCELRFWKPLVAASANLLKGLKDALKKKMNSRARVLVAESFADYMLDADISAAGDERSSLVPTDISKGELQQIIGPEFESMLSNCDEAHLYLCRCQLCFLELFSLYVKIFVEDVSGAKPGKWRAYYVRRVPRLATWASKAARAHLGDSLTVAPQMLGATTESTPAVEARSVCVCCLDQDAVLVGKQCGHVAWCRSCRRKAVWQHLGKNVSRRDLSSKQLERTKIACPICRKMTTLVEPAQSIERIVVPLCE